ncbi:tetratricopeptide repeat protein [Helicobacter pylori]|uniref:tetratricopeptide repeat protein n=1 Tax=Helicobacter pylori TaxID=210 RepID=UPI00095824DA|nr:tetratricopeptide repeat protein [Helicobacter pylori]BAW63779.1 cysteine-rich protein H [Helicobacter pylori]
MAEPNPEELFDQGEDILNFALNGGGGTFRLDNLEAKEYFEKACELNYAKGCVNLGSLYQGEGLVIGEKNPRLKERLKKAVQYYSKACDLNDYHGCSTLGAMQYQGKIVVKNEKQAMKKFEKACKLGYKEACEMVTHKGLCELGHKEACEIFSLEVLCRLSDLKACAMSYDKRKALDF